MSEASQGPVRRRRAIPEDPVVTVVASALQVGVACGSAGFLLGGASGIVKGTAPFLFATASGIQTFALGTTYWGLRSAILQTSAPKDRKPSDLVKASTVSGGITGGAIAFITRGRSNAIPGAIMFSLFGFLGQKTGNWYCARSAPDPEAKGFWMRMSEKSFSPVTVLTNDQYAKMLQEKLLKVDVEISVIEDKIAALKQEQQEQQEQQQRPPAEQELASSTPEP